MGGGGDEGGWGGGVLDEPSCKSLVQKAKNAFDAQNHNYEEHEVEERKLDLFRADYLHVHVNISIQLQLRLKESLLQEQGVHEK